MGKEGKKGRAPQVPNIYIPYGPTTTLLSVAESSVWQAGSWPCMGSLMSPCIGVVVPRVWAGSRAGLGCAGAAGVQQGSEKEGGCDTYTCYIPPQ